MPGSVEVQLHLSRVRHTVLWTDPEGDPPDAFSLKCAPPGRGASYDPATMPPLDFIQSVRLKDAFLVVVAYAIVSAPLTHQQSMLS